MLSLIELFTLYFNLQSIRGDSLESDAAASGIYETVRSEVRRAISEIQNDLESVCSSIGLLDIYYIFLFHYIISDIKL